MYVYIRNPTTDTATIELAIATGEFAQTAGDLASSDVGKQLSNSLSGLAGVEKKAHDLQTAQSEHDMVTLMSTGLFSISILYLLLLLTSRNSR